MPEARRRGHPAWTLPAAVLALAVLVFGLYGKSLDNPLIFDDLHSLQAGGILWNYGGTVELKQRVVSYTTFVWNHAMAGEDWFWYRLTNTALHFFAVLAIWGLCRRLFGAVLPADTRGLSPGQYAVLGAAIFAAHPVAVYGVAYLIQRSIIMATLFAVLALWCVLEALLARRRGWLWLFPALGAYALAVLSKEYAAGMPLAALGLALLVHPPSRAQVRRYWWTVIPVLAALGLAGGFLWERYGNIFGAVFDDNSRRFVAELARTAPLVAEHPHLLSALNETWLFFRYLLLWFLPWPGWMNIDLRPPFPLSFTSFPHILGLVGYLLWPLASLWLILRRGRAGLFGLAMLWPWVLYPTELATVWIQDPFVLYRSYLWMALLPAFLPLLLGGLPRPAAGSIGVVFLAFCLWAASNRLDTFESEYHVWNDAVAGNAPGEGVVGLWRPVNNRGKALYLMGRLDLAMADFDRAAQLAPDRPDPLLNRGATLTELGRPEQALADLDRAVELGPEQSATWYNRGVAWISLGRFDQALADLDEAVKKLEPNSTIAPMVYSNRGVARVETGDTAGGVADFEKSVEINPNQPKAWANIGVMSLRLGDPQRAVDAFTRIIELGDAVNARYGRATAWLDLDRPAEAVTDLDAAVRLDPADREVHELRARALTRAGELPRAIAEYDLLLRQTPDHPGLHEDRARVLMQAGRLPEARQSYQRACELGAAGACLLARGLAGDGG